MAILNVLSKQYETDRVNELLLSLQDSLNFLHAIPTCAFTLKASYENEPKEYVANILVDNDIIKYVKHGVIKEMYTNFHSIQSKISEIPDIALSQEDKQILNEVESILRSWD